MDQNRRGYGHRGRRGPDRRGGDRRASQPPQTSRGEHLNVEQLMREIRARVAQKHGINLTEQQVQDLAARRLESILELRTISPALVEQFRRSASGERTAVLQQKTVEPPYTFEATTLYDSHRPLMRAIRRLLNPILKLFFNPNPLIQALHTQARFNAEGTHREVEQAQRQAEWNALHYELLQRVVSETAQLSLEVRDLALRVEALSTKVDFNERRVKGIEGALHESAAGSTDAIPSRGVEEAAGPDAAAEAVPVESPRRRRRRRRGRRGPVAGEPPAQVSAQTQPSVEGMLSEPPAEGPESGVPSGSIAPDHTPEPSADRAARPVIDEPAPEPPPSVQPAAPPSETDHGEQ